MSMHARWLDERRREHYHKLAKEEGYRSRASFKIMQIDDHFNIFKRGNSIVDLGASPGGWLQVARERVGASGKVIGVDLKPIKPINGVTTIIGDITNNDTVFDLLDKLKGKADIVLSDMAPNITGCYSIDHARSIHLCMSAIDICNRILKINGQFVTKVFMGNMLNILMNRLKTHFQSVKIYSPDASRPTSSEIYVISKGFLPSTTSNIQCIKKSKDNNEFYKRGDLP
ncbi:MAG: RlmE family RNA methyltransferase [archaeon]|nr:RlmE family RNA methyltransferase [archaeon]